jgi:hypothetical protein
MGHVSWLLPIPDFHNSGRTRFVGCVVLGGRWFQARFDADTWMTAIRHGAPSVRIQFLIAPLQIKIKVFF